MSALSTQDKFDIPESTPLFTHDQVDDVLSK